MRFLSLALAIVACQASSVGQPNATVTPTQRAAIADTVQKLTSDFLAAMQSVDADKASSFDTRSPDYAFLSEDGGICRTPETCAKMNKEGWQSVKSMQIRVADSKIAVASPTVAVETMNIGGSIFPKSGKPVVIDKAAITIVWVREAAGWKMLTFHQSFTPPKTQS